MDTLEPIIPVYIRSHVQQTIGLEILHIEEAKSAQQRVLIFQFEDDRNMDKEQRQEISPLVRSALESGGYCLVVRIWKGGSRWWNLHQAKDVQTLAAAEMEGYQLAHEALGAKIPKLLHASHHQQDETESPWALLEYVGEKSTRFDGASKEYDQFWTESMIQVREEFGFFEPHPRWGRVPASQSLPYGLRILHHVIIPLHRYLFANTHAVSAKQIHHLCGDEELGSEASGYTYRRMIQQYKRAIQAMQNSLQNAESKDEKLSESLMVLAQCISKLDNEPIAVLPGVLLHMDCQPQNLVFAKTQEEDPWCISSVLDWEDCAYGDPRFELLLLGRKVCANREQAQVLWTRYQEQFPELKLGSLDVWLHLETCHSLCTLLLQSMDLLDGGRSPWETKPDLWGKIEREFSRLAHAGWAFCQKVAVRKD